MPWPDGLPAAWACLAEPLGNGVHVAERVRSAQPESALVIGAGPIGLMVLQALKALLEIPVFVVDLIPERLEAARSIGAEEAVESSESSLKALMNDRTSGRGFDVVVDAAGNGATKSLSLKSLRDEGLAVWIGLGSDEIRLHTYPITLREQTVTGSYGATADDMAAALRLMAERRVDVESWVSRYPLERAPDAFLRQLDPEQRDIKVVIEIAP